jgi:hypothetical protein
VRATFFFGGFLTFGAIFFTAGLGFLLTFGFAIDGFLTGGFLTGGGAGIVAVVDDGPLPFRPSMTIRPSWI